MRKMDDDMDDNITYYNRGRWSEENLFIIPEKVTHPNFIISIKFLIF